MHNNNYREKDEARKTKFNDEYHPDTTDCQAELPFATVDSFSYKLGQISTMMCNIVSFILMVLPGPEFLLMQSIPCSLAKLMTFFSLAIGRLLHSIIKVF